MTTLCCEVFVCVVGGCSDFCVVFVSLGSCSVFMDLDEKWSIAFLYQS